MSVPTTASLTTPAIDGGAKTRETPMPVRKLFGEAEKAAVSSLIDRAVAEGSHLLGYGGEQERAYCEAFCESLGGGYADGVNSGTNALYVALAALELEPLSEVIVPPITDPGGVMPVAMAGCVPVAADAAPESGFNVTPEQVERVITPRTRAVVVAHIAGIPVDMDGIRDLGYKHNLAIVEDCAQAHGATYKGQPCGTFGCVAAFSTMFGKHHASGGQGGLVYTRDAALFDRVRRHADRGKPFGIEPPPGNVACAINCNMDELHAAIGRVNLAKLPAMVERRRAVARRIAEGVADLETVSMWQERNGDAASYWFLTFALDIDKLGVDRDRFIEALLAEGLSVVAGYPFFPVRMPWMTDRCGVCRRGQACDLPGCAMRSSHDTTLPNATAFEARSIRVIIHEGWSDRDADDLVTALAKLDTAYAR